MPDLRKSSTIKFLDLIEEVSKEIKINYKTIAILGTTKTKNSKLYNIALKNSNIKIIYPNRKQQQKVSQIILRIIRNKDSKKDKRYLNNLIKVLIKQGAEKVILACTDLGNLIKNNKNALDTTDILINSIVKEMKGGSKI
jgi:aspartate/glutamate racemase|tara:strand:- start:236 stop:655 length:420 start_codon:yes stop_codon:yes gene_type:complete